MPAKLRVYTEAKIRREERITRLGVRWSLSKVTSVGFLTNRQKREIKGGIFMTKVEVCALCGEPIEEGELFCQALDEKGNLVAVDKFCANATLQLRQCEYCGKWYICDEHTPDRDGRPPYDDNQGSWISHEQRWVCKDCLAENFVRCAICGEWVHKDDAESESQVHSSCRDYKAQFGED